MDMALINANVITMALPNKREQAVAIHEGRITHVGSNRAVQEALSETTPVIDLGGRTILPGLIDSHMHAFVTGIALTGARLETAATVEDVCERLGDSGKDDAPR